MNYYGYEVLPKYVSPSGDLLWEVTGCGEKILGTKGGKTYFIKRDTSVRGGDLSGLPPKVQEAYKEKADALEFKQKKIASLMKGLSLRTHHVVVEEDHFWDSSNKFVTITALVPNVVEDDTYDYLKRLSALDFIEFVKKSAKLIADTHACKVIHGDLKVKNIVVSKEGTKYIPYLIDFDCSYPFDMVPTDDNIPGSIGYFSPETQLRFDEETEKSEINCKTDIYTLALIWHHWWTGNFPYYDDSKGATCCADASNLGLEFSYDKKFDVKLGDKQGATLMSLVNWMLAPLSQDRPTAEQILEVLNDTLAVPLEYHKGSDAKPFDETVWFEHQKMATLLSQAELQAKGLVSFKKVREAGIGGYKYHVILSDGTEQRLDIYGLFDNGYATKKLATVEEAWDGDFIEFVSPEKMLDKGVVSIKKATLNVALRPYRLSYANGITITVYKKWLLTEGLATEKSVSVVADTPWPEHGTTYNVLAMAQNGVKSIQRVEIGGEKRYRVEYDRIVDGKPFVLESAPANNLILMGYIK
ncbi:MAG: hypothetical protein J6C97_04540 [Clostridia bacterium]|nr:hypothetical protein [Clostridia bacterium]